LTLSPTAKFAGLVPLKMVIAPVLSATATKSPETLVIIPKNSTEPDVCSLTSLIEGYHSTLIAWLAVILSVKVLASVLMLPT